MNIKDIYSEFIYKRTYSRWLEDKQRRETWEETVERYRLFFLPRVPESMLNDFENAIRYVREKEIMPSMRCLWTAGKALEEDNIAGYNCSFVVVDKPKVFSEVLYILLHGAGVGFSTERQWITELPEVPSLIYPNDEVITVQDSKIGWAEAYEQLINMLYNGLLPSFDYSLIRPAGARLKTFGGRASGSEPLKELFEFTINAFQHAKGRKLKSIEVYDIVCKIANCVVVGGVRRSATINLSNLSDDRMRHAKEGQFWLDNPQRSLSNNSAAYTEKPDMNIFMEEWMSLMKSGTGERGIFNREAAMKGNARRVFNTEKIGTNPCGEIVLRSKQFCNLTEVVIKPDDCMLMMRKKIHYATLLGCLQATLTKFNFLSKEWEMNTTEERLLGVSLTGLQDNWLTNALQEDETLENVFTSLKYVAIESARETANTLGINVPAAITCVKPSGTVSQLVGCSSGLHSRYARYYIRRVRVNAGDPLAKLLIDQGLSYNPEVGQTLESATTLVFDFPLQAANTTITKDQLTALQQLNYWKIIKEYWCEHNPSATIYVKDHEWLAVGAWVYEHWDIVGGLSFLPDTGGVYALAPYEEITEAKFLELLEKFPELDFSKLSGYEREDNTEGAKTYACVGDKCELV